MSLRVPLSDSLTSSQDGCGMYFRRSLRAVFLGSKMNVLLIAIPFAFISNYLEWGPIPTFVLSMVGLCPLAERYTSLHHIHNPSLSSRHRIAQLSGNLHTASLAAVLSCSLESAL